MLLVVLAGLITCARCGSSRVLAVTSPRVLAVTSPRVLAVASSRVLVLAWNE